MPVAKFLQGLVAFAALLTLASCSRQNDLTVLKLAHSLDTKHPVHQGIVYMAERLQKHSNGTMKIDIYPSGQLGEEREMMELLQIGSLAMTKVSSSPMEGFVPAMKVFNVPYVFRDQQHYWQVLDSYIGKGLLLAGESVKLRGLGYFDAGSRSFYSTEKPIHTPDDLSGVKVRVQQSQTSIQMVRSLGGSATPISWGELYTSLQQGVVDAAENNPPSFYSSKHYEVCKYFTLDEHTMVPDILLISSYIWNKLTPQQQQWLQLSMDEAVVFQRKLWAEATEIALQEVQKAGVEIIYPDKSLFQSKVQTMHQSLQGTPAYQLLQQIQEMQSNQAQTGQN